MLELTKTCRLCGDWSNPDVDNIFFTENQNFTTLILKYLSIHIGFDDCLPKNICYQCKSTLLLFDEYALKCTTIQLTLSSVAEQLPSAEPLVDVKAEHVLDLAECPPLESRGKLLLKSEDENYNDNDSSRYSEGFCEYKDDTKKIYKLKSKKKKASKSILKKKKNNLKEATKSQIMDTIINNEILEIKNEVFSDDETPLLKYKSKGFGINNSFIDFHCHLCPENFSTWATLSRHTKQCHSTIPLITCVCTKDLRSKRSVYEHILKHDKTTGFRCEECDKRFLTEKYYKIHIAKHGSDSFNSYKCVKCDKVFPTSSLLNNHEKLHIPLEMRLIHPCDICGSKFLSKYYVDQHIRSVHKKEKSHMCDVCGMGFSTRGALKEHGNKHSIERTLQCPFCPKRFKTKATLKRHIDCHNGVKFKCAECSTTFNYKRTLEEHMFTHKDVYRYICNLCNKGFKWKSSYQTHMNNHTGDSPFSCPWCLKTFRDRSNCRIHKRRSHPTELAELESQKGTSVSNNSVKKKMDKSEKPNTLKKDFNLTKSKSIVISATLE